MTSSCSMVERFVYVGGSYVSGKNIQFLDQFEDDLLKFLSNLDDYRALIFPPFPSKYRWLAHKFVESFFYPELSSFSVGRDNQRRVVIAKTHVLMKYISPFKCVHEKLQQLNEQGEKLPCICLSSVRENMIPADDCQTSLDDKLAISSKSVKSVATALSKADGCETTSSFSEVQTTKSSILSKHKTIESRKKKRPDKQLYVPRARRLIDGEFLLNNPTNQGSVEMQFRDRKEAFSRMLDSKVGESLHCENVGNNAPTGRQAFPETDSLSANNNSSFSKNFRFEGVEGKQTYYSSSPIVEQCNTVGGGETLLDPSINIGNQMNARVDSDTQNGDSSAMHDSDNVSLCVKELSEQKILSKSNIKASSNESLKIENVDLGKMRQLPKLSSLCAGVMPMHEGELLNLKESLQDDRIESSRDHSYLVSCDNKKTSTSRVLSGFNLDGMASTKEVFCSGLSSEFNNNSCFTADMELSSHLNTESDSWEAMFNDDGECLNPETFKELTSVIGDLEVDSAKNKYFDFKTAENRFSGGRSTQVESAVDFENDTDLSNIVELYDFPIEFNTQDLVSALSCFKSQDYIIKWVDDCHAFVVFSSPFLALQALELEHPFVKIRPISQGIRASKLKARSCADSFEPSKPRPATSVALARRLVTSALGLKVRVPKEQRERERKEVLEAREQRQKAARRRENMWAGVIP